MPAPKSSPHAAHAANHHSARPVAPSVRQPEPEVALDDEAPEEYAGDSADDFDGEDMPASAGKPLPPVIEEYTAEDYLIDELVPMPSGKGLRLAKLSLISLVRSGQVPPNLLGTARRLLKMSESAEESGPRAGNRAQERYAQHHGQQQRQNQQPTNGKPLTNEDAVALREWAVCQCVRSFRVVDKMQEDCEPGEVSIQKILDPDQQAIFNYIMRGQTALADFRPQS